MKRWEVIYKKGTYVKYTIVYACDEAEVRSIVTSTHPDYTIVGIIEYVI
jgi:hypothetical protein